MQELARVDGAAGLIAVDAQGQLFETRNTPFMATARRAIAAS